MKKYLQRLREHPGLDTVIIVMVLSTLAGGTNKSAPSLGSGALFGFLFSFVFILIPFLISNVHINRKRTSKLKNNKKNMENNIESGKWKPKPGEDYYFVDFNSHGLLVGKSTNWGALINVSHLEDNNCFQDKQGAEQAISKIKILLSSN